MYKTLALHTEVLAGSNVKDATREMVELSQRMGMMVLADFNGFHAIATPKTDPEELAKEYHRFRR